jgi:hypothetical protein
MKPSLVCIVNQCLSRLRRKRPARALKPSWLSEEAKQQLIKALYVTAMSFLLAVAHDHWPVVQESRDPTTSQLG